MRASYTVLRGERLHLRPLSEADCGERYLGWLNDDAVHQFLETRHSAQTLDSIRAFVKAVNARANEHLFGIFLNGDGQHIGNIKVGPVGAYHPLADVSLLIGERSCWGKGYAREAILLITRHAFDDLGIKKLSASMYDRNVGSMKAFLAIGYKHEGRRRRHYMLDGEMVDLVELGATPDDVAP